MNLLFPKTTKILRAIANERFGDIPAVNFTVIKKLLDVVKMDVVYTMITDGKDKQATDFFDILTTFSEFHTEEECEKFSEKFLKKNPLLLTRMI